MFGYVSKSLLRCRFYEQVASEDVNQMSDNNKKQKVSGRQAAERKRRELCNFDKLSFKQKHGKTCCFAKLVLFSLMSVEPCTVLVLVIHTLETSEEWKGLSIAALAAEILIDFDMNKGVWTNPWRHSEWKASSEV